MKNVLLTFVDWVYKTKCYICSATYENKKLCSSCYDKIELFTARANRILCGKNVFCACEYSDIVQKIIRGLKYHNQRALAYYQARIMFDYWQKLNKTENFVIVPVPLSKERLKHRKYNHMELVAEEFSRLTGYDVDTQLIVRIKDTKPQYKLTRKQRLENLQNAFDVHIENYSGKPLLIIDDICTTGATFESMICELKKHGIERIICFATSTPIS